MTLLRSLVMALSCFSQVPVPQVEWKPESMRYMMAFFPLVGVIVSALVALWLWLADVCGFGDILRAAGMTLVPVLVTGGIHLDGFADTCDGLASNAEPERRRQILKDPNAGAFAVIGTVSYFVAYFALAAEFDPSFGIAQLMVVPVLSRSLSGIATIAFPKSTTEGMLASFQVSADKRPVLVALVLVACACCAALVVLNPIVGAVLVVVALACLVVLRFVADRAFAGMSGDLAGFFLQMAELAMLACLAIAS